LFVIGHQGSGSLATDRTREREKWFIPRRLNVHPLNFPIHYQAMSSSIADWQSLHGAAFKRAEVLVTGGAGFIGSHLSLALISLGAKVTVLDDLSNEIADAASVLESAELITGSILDESLLAKCAAGKRFVFHLAALGSVPRSLEQPRIYHDVNSTGTLNVLEAARQAKVQRVIYSASSSAYGDTPTLPKTESMPPQPLSPYAATKLAGEMDCSAYSASFGLDTACLRYFNIFGPRQNPNSAYAAVIAAFAAALLSGKQPVIYGDGTQSRDFTYVDNAVHANLLAARCEMPVHGRPINIACGAAISISDLARRMAQHLNRPELTPIYKPARKGDVLHSLADLRLADQLLSYRPIVGLDAGLAATIDWYKSTHTSRITGPA
jgi:nucleoside-diphosphate-sugar epimerase